MAVAEKITGTKRGSRTRDSTGQDATAGAGATAADAGAAGVVSTQPTRQASSYAAGRYKTAVTRLKAACEDPSRLHLLSILSDGQWTLEDLKGAFRGGGADVQSHLEAMRRAGLVQRSGKGNYSITADGLAAWTAAREFVA